MGNITVGGTGKTPTAQKLLLLLKIWVIVSDPESVVIVRTGIRRLGVVSGRRFLL